MPYTPSLFLKYTRAGKLRLLPASEVTQILALLLSTALPEVSDLNLQTDIHTRYIRQSFPTCGRTTTSSMGGNSCSAKAEEPQIGDH